MPGLFVTFEGPEGAGKSTQIRLLGDALRAGGYSVVVTREPGGTAIGEQIRAILLDRTSAGMAAETEALLHTAARAQHVRELIAPAIARGDIVLCDRFAESTLAYQGGGRGLSLDLLQQVQNLATGGLEPDLRVLLDIDVELGLRRRRGEADSTNRMDDEDLAFHERVRATYHALATSAPAGWAVIDADRGLNEVAADIELVVSRALELAGMTAQDLAGAKL